MMTDVQRENKITFPLVLLFVYIFAEYGRPAFLTPFHLGLVLQSIFLLLLVKNAGKVKAIMKDRYFMLYLILLALMMVHGPIAVNNYWAFMEWKNMVGLLIFSIAFCAFIDNAAKLRIFLMAFIAILALTALDQIVFNRLHLGFGGFMGDKNDFALAMNVVIPISFYMGLSYKGVKRVGFWMATLLLIMANVQTFSRGGFVGMACMAFLCWWNSKLKLKSLLLLFLIAGVFVSLIPQEYKAELYSIREEGSEKGTGRDRVELWKLGWKIFLDNPIIGVGQGNLPHRLGEYQYDRSGNSYWQRGMGGRVTHSIYFTVIPELGIIGVLIWVLMLRNLFLKYRHVVKSFLKNNEATQSDDKVLILKNSMLGISIGLVGYLVSGVFLSAFYYPQFWHLSALITATYMITSRMERENAAIANQAHLVNTYSKNFILSAQKGHGTFSA